MSNDIDRKNVYVVGNTYRCPWGRGETIQEARKNAGLKKMDHYTAHYFNHDKWVILGDGGVSWPPDTEPPTCLTYYKGEVIAIRLCGRGEAYTAEGWEHIRKDLYVMEHPDTECADKDRVKGILPYREQDSKYTENPNYNGFNILWMDEAAEVDDAPVA